MLSQTDKELIRAIQEGDYRAFELLFVRYYSDLCRVARSYTHSNSVAEDLVSDLFLKLWEQPHSLAANTSLKGYLHRAVYNSCINYLTRTKFKTGIPDPEMIEKLADLIQPPSADAPYFSLMAEELEQEIDKAISQLPTECGKIFVMSRKELLSHREIAEKLHISENTVKVQIYKALSKLRDTLKEYL